MLEACVGCGAPVTGSYCANCGERRASERDNSLRGFVAEVFATVTSTDRSIVGTVKLLLWKPGELTAEFMRGRRAGLMRPLQLFLLVNVGFFIWSTATNNRMFDTPLGTHMNYSWHKGLARRWVRARVAERKITLTAYAKQFDEAATVQAKTLIVTMVPVFALHTYSALLILCFLVAYALFLPMSLVDRITHTRSGGNQVSDNLFGLVLVSSIVWYLRRSMIRVYGDGRAFATVAAIGLALAIGYILFAYRTLLFLTTFYST